MARPLRIAIVTTAYPPEDGGGIGTYTEALAQGLAALGQEVHVLAASSVDALERRGAVCLHRMRPRHLPRVEHQVPGLAWSAQVALRLSTIARRGRLDIVEFPNWEGAGLVYALVPLRATVVTRLHTPFFETLSLDAGGRAPLWGERFTCWLEEQAVRRSDQLTSSTVHHRGLMARAYRIPEDRVHILPLGIPLPAAEEASPQLGRRPRVLYVSRLEHRKGTLTLLDAVPKILAAVGPVEFVLVGKDRPHAPGGQRFADYFRQRYPDAQEHVSFLGFVEAGELVRQYQSCDLFVVPSQYESFGLIFLEAMARGKPVIGCRAGGMVEVIADGETGYLLPVGDTDALVDRVVGLLRDEELRRRMGRAARRRVEERFSAEVMAGRTLELYREWARP